MKRTVTSLALIAALSTAGAASAIEYNAFGLTETQDASSRVEVGLVRSATAGEVQIYAYETGEVGALLGETSVHAGANPNVFVNVGATPSTDVIAVLYDANGNATAETILELDQ